MARAPVDYIESEEFESSAASDALHEWRQHFIAMSEVRAIKPDWVIRNAIVPGLNFVVAPPKHFKSTYILELIATMIGHSHGVGGDAAMKPRQRGACMYFAAEQSVYDLKHIYEERIIKRKWNKGPVSWDFAVAKDVMEWALDEHDSDHDLTRFIEKAKPAMVILDPFYHFHHMEENDPHVARLLIKPTKAIKKHGGALVVVHHERKESSQNNGASNQSGNWNKMRGTSALWALADGGTMLSKAGAGRMKVFSEFKTHPSLEWVWTVP